MRNTYQLQGSRPNNVKRSSYGFNSFAQEVLQLITCSKNVSYLQGSCHRACTAKSTARSSAGISYHSFRKAAAMDVGIAAISQAAKLPGASWTR